VTQRQLERLVARKTGDELETIRRLGFELEPPSGDLHPLDDDGFREPLMVDWDDLEQTRGRSLSRGLFPHLDHDETLDLH